MKKLRFPHEPAGPSLIDGKPDIRRLLIIGAAVVVRRAVCKGATEGFWFARILARKPIMLVAVA
jgi:transposase